MNEEFWLQATLQRLLAVEGDDWRQRTADIVEDARRLFKDRAISADAYEAVETVYLGRLERTAGSKAKHEARETSRPGLSKTTRSGIRVAPEVKASGVRGSSRYTPEERAERADRRWEQVHLCGAPAGVLKRLRAAACAVLAIIVFDCRTIAEATCERSVARIAGAAAVSERAVQYALLCLPISA